MNEVYLFLMWILSIFVVIILIKNKHLVSCNVFVDWIKKPLEINDMANWVTLFSSSSFNKSEIQLYQSSTRWNMKEVMFNFYAENI